MMMEPPPLCNGQKGPPVASPAGKPDPNPAREEAFLHASVSVLCELGDVGGAGTLENLVWVLVLMQLNNPAVSIEHCV